MTLYSFSHYLQAWLLPPGIHFFIIALGFLVCFFYILAGRMLMFIGITSLWLLSMPIVAYQLVNTLQNQYPILETRDLQDQVHHTAIVVLGGGDTIQAEYDHQHTVSDFTLHRINYAVYLQQKLHLPILLSGGKTNGSRESEAELMARVLQNNFHMKADYLENQSLTTADESQFVRSMMQKNRFDQVYLVTHAWHMPRSAYIFQCAGIKVIPAPMGHFVYGPGYALVSYFPNMDALYASSIALHEWLGLLWYHLRYGRQCVSGSLW